jgi:hypothetical protein
MRSSSSPLFNDLWHHEQTIRSRRSIANGFLVAEGGTNFVGSCDIDERKGVGGWLDVADIDFFKLFDVAENVAQLSANFLLFLRGQSKTGEMRNVFDVDFGSGHFGKF